ncbi:MAG: CARDB domain-containing protein [Kofleriaceae bacterium]
MRRTRIWLWSVVLCGACGGVDLTANAPAFPSSTVTTTPVNFTATFSIDGELPSDSGDIYLTMEYRPPNGAGFVFFDNAQISRATATLMEPVTYVFLGSDGRGTYAFRAVVDAGGLIDESDENNNVSPTTMVTVP